MAKTIPVTCNGKFSYSIEIRDSFSDFLPALMQLQYDSTKKICIVSDSNVAPLYMDELKIMLSTSFQLVTDFVFEAGEASKNIDTVQQLYEHLIINGFDRHDFLIALGGGVVGDLTGFAAATYLRGIDFIQVPTTLLAQVDSSIGGKTGVDFKQFKNMVGAFHQPKLVYMNLSVLQSLPNRQLAAGTAEILKHGLIKDKSYFDWMNRHHKDVFELQFEALEEMIFRSCNIKREVVENDPTEKGERALLNFGHTIGHAIEKLSDFTLYHGECVAIGMIAAAYISMREGDISKSEFAYIQDTIQMYDLPTNVGGQNAEDIHKVSKSDKKMKAGKINFILLKTLGQAYMYHELADDDVLDAIWYVTKED